MIKIEILGTGCAKCKRLFANAEQAVKDLKITAEIVKVEDLAEIVGRGVINRSAHRGIRPSSDCGGRMVFTDRTDQTGKVYTGRGHHDN
jgi:hypothetical protein